MPDLTPEEWIDLIVRRASALRDAGVKHLELGGMKVDLADAMPELGGEPPQEPKGLWDDPDTYGGAVPTLRRDDA